jgi:hypothetical protein
MVLGVPAFASVPALAAAPEAPETKAVTAVTATTATFHGLLDPTKASTELVVEYIFFYAPGGAACTEGSVAPESPGMASGKEGEAVELSLTGLQPNAQYEVCLATRNPGEEGWTVGNSVPFPTPPASPAIESLSVANAKTSEVTLEGVVNPNNEATECEFQYGTVSVSENTWPCKPELLKGYGGQGVSSTKFNEQGQTVEAIAGLTEGATYKYRILVKNATGEESKEGAFQTFESPEAQKATAVTATTAIFNGVLNPRGEYKEEPGSYEFVYRQSATECRYVLSPEQEATLEREGKTAELEADRAKAAENKSTASEAATGAEKEPAKTEATGLLPGATYTFCLLVRDASGTEAALGTPETFTTGAAAPTIEETFVTGVAATSATLHASVNPRGAKTSYAFEYAPAGGAFKPVPEPEGSGTLPAGPSAVKLSVHMQHELAPGATYEFRLIVSGSMQKDVTGEPVSFTTQRAGGELAAAGLPDGRQYEMVSPEQKEGTLFGHIAEAGLIQAAADGDAFADWSFFEPTEGKAAGAYASEQANFFGRGPGGWTAKTITPPHSAPGSFPVGQGTEYRFFSEDLSEAIVQPFGPVTPLAPGVDESTPYIHSDYLNGSPNEQCGSDCYQPLVSEENVPTGTKYGGEANEPCADSLCGPLVVGVTPDLSHVLISSSVALTAGSGGGLYEWADGELTFVGNGGLGSEGLSRHVISDDGSRVFINGSYEGVEGLLMRDTVTGETIRLDVPQESGLPPVSPQQAEFETASADGSRIFFLDSGRLTANSGASVTDNNGNYVEAKPDLYECQISQEAATGKDKCDLTDLTPEAGGESADVETVLGASEDGSYVYFVAGGGLAGASPGACGDQIEIAERLDRGEMQLCNLYVRHDGATRLVAGLSPEDASSWGQSFDALRMTARVSPNGQWLAFMSERDLTGYDTTDAVSGHPDEEVYLYDASDGKLVCASCNPTGARPVGVEYNSNEQIVAGNRVFDFGKGIASNIPQWTPNAGATASYQSRYLSDSGRLFFDSHDALVPQDVNGTQDVYEYEPEGVPEGAHACASSSESASDVFKPAHIFELEGRKGEESAGCVALISLGESNEESAFLDASETGGDVFFLTASNLAPQDSDNAYDIYDARECGSGPSRCLAPIPVSPPPCSTGDSCKPASTPQPATFGSPASATFSGAGNVTSSPALKKVIKKKTVKCKKGLVKNKKGKCVRKKSKKRTKRATDDWRAKR